MNAIEILRSHRPEVGDYEAEFDAALAAVEALVDEAQAVTLFISDARLDVLTACVQRVREELV